MKPIVRGIDRFATKHELTQLLNVSSVPTHVLGGEGDGPYKFYCLHVFLPTIGEVNLAILSVGGGTEPSWIVKNARVFIGFNDRVAIIWSSPRLEIRQANLLTLCAGFVDAPALSYVVVMGESAVIAISNDAEVIWRQDTDLITDFRLEGMRLRLTFSDELPLTIDLSQPGQGSEKAGMG